ncbi:MAG: tripartite tricarboxylate transporter substrate binding protein [Betaproteobacteria bacterium]|nr:tripartite tricarboxylate transporter substrate binding protein [Betaproteobacteria bacterium]
MTFSLTRLIGPLGVVLASMLLAAASHAQEAFPSRPVRMVVPYPPGGIGDFVARLIAPKWSEALKQQIVVENRPGAGSNIGIDHVAKAAPDGYTVLLFDSALVVNASLYTRLSYDARRDLAPIMIVGRTPLVLAVHPTLSAANVTELIELARARPGGLTYASAGSGTLVHLAAEMLKTAASIDIVHVPYKGAGQAILDVIGGQVPMMFAVPGTARAHIASGKLRPLALTGEKRFSGLPAVPTFAEAGIRGMDASLIVGLMVPARTPAAVLATLHDTLASVTAQPEIIGKLGESGMDMVRSAPQPSEAILANEFALWERVVRSSGAKVE